MIKRLLFLIFLVTSVLSLFCGDKPQRKGWISFDAFSALDHIATIFEGINDKLPKLNETITVNGAAYSFINFTVGAWYSSAAQQESFFNETVSKVSAGKLTISYDFNYAIEGGSTGIAYGHVVAQKFGFKKSIYLNNGLLAWDLVSVDTITILSERNISFSNPVLSDADKKVFEDLLNDRTENKSSVLSKSLETINSNFQKDLKDFLENEDIVNLNNEQYSYGGLNVTYTSAIKDKILSGVGFKGLEYSCFFELENYTTQCVDLPVQYSLVQDYGGLQQLIAFPWLDANLRFLAKNEYFSINLNANTWQSNFFQFYMGDVANVIEEASKAKPITPISIDCSWQSDQQDKTYVEHFTLTTFYAQVPLKCVITSANTTIQTIKFNLINIISLVLGSKSLNVKVKNIVTQKITYESAGNYVVTNPNAANQLVHSVASKLINKNVFGHGFKTTERKAPALIMRRNYLVMYDSSIV